MNKKNILFQPNLYIVTDETITHTNMTNQYSHEDILNAAIRNNIKMIQLREKNNLDRLKSAANYFSQKTKNKNILFILNDHVDIAIRYNADGVHLGQNDTSLLKARRMLGKEKIIGISCHSLEEALQAEADGADYINIGPIFETQTKKTDMKNLGTLLINRVKAHLKIPFSIMGGIKINNVEKTLEAGAKIVAVVTEISLAQNIDKNIQKLMTKINQFY